MWGTFCSTIFRHQRHYMNVTRALQKQRIFPIKLTEKEQKIQKILLNVVEHLEQTNSTKITLRIAGGWVRDKVVNSHIVNGARIQRY
jgi:hypothetical protein